MPPKDLPEKAQEIYLAAEKAALSGTCDNDVECASKVAWSAVKKNFYKDSSGNWVPKSNFNEFSFAIVKASFDKSSQEMRWRAIASDTEDDLYGDNMTKELFVSFLNRIKSGEAPPVISIAEGWQGGIPYLSIAHYPYLDGEGVPGDIESIYIDGEQLKAKGTFRNTELGRRCFSSVLDDLYSDSPDFDEKVRISIAFLDYKHQHKSDDSVFERSGVNDICIPCLLDFLTGEQSGKSFMDGHLVHLALTRVPVNPRTPVELEERSMEEIKTREDDATSIIGDDEAERLAALAAEQQKSQAIVIKSSEPTVDDVLSEEGSVLSEDYLDDNQEIRVRDGGEVTLSLLSDAWEIVIGQPESDERNSQVQKLEALYRSIGETPPKIEVGNMDEQTREVLENLQDQVSALSQTVLDQVELVTEVVEDAIDEHILDNALNELKNIFDEQEKSDVSNEDRLRALQVPYQELGDVIRAHFSESEEESVIDASVSKAIADAIAPVQESINILLQQGNMENVTTVPQRRSLQPGEVGNPSNATGMKTVKQIARESSGLQA